MPGNSPAEGKRKKMDDYMDLFLAQTNELDFVVALVNQAYRGALAPSWDSEVGIIEGRRTDVASLLRMIDDGSIILLAKEAASTTALGCVALRPDDNGRWYLSMLAVQSGLQAAGFGRSIMSAADSYARACGASEIWISVINVREQLIKWYERRGYERTGDIQAFPYDDPSVGTPLSKDLTLISMKKTLVL
ncbi:GNAT family N-acetyltransferase [Agrobacterium vitis]|nr:GNAT family N-acetyltransferase [Allorhizobium ampelinum]MVA45894.1 GNAT family N-acetyltransferase [Agrobacterium vitis]